LGVRLLAAGLSGCGEVLASLSLGGKAQPFIWRPCKLAGQIGLRAWRRCAGVVAAPFAAIDAMP